MGKKAGEQKLKKRSSKKLGGKSVEKHELGHAKIQKAKNSFTKTAQKFSQTRILKIIPPISKKSAKYGDHPLQCWTRICSPDCIYYYGVHSTLYYHVEVVQSSN